MPGFGMARTLKPDECTPAPPHTRVWRNGALLEKSNKRDELMLKYILKRLGYMLIVLTIMSVFFFVLYEFMPGDRVRSFMPDTAGWTAEMIEIEYQLISDMLGIGQNPFVRYSRWITNMLTGDMGFSVFYRRPVVDVIRTPIMWTVVLNLVVMAFTLGLTIPIGIITAVKRGSLFDNGALVLTVLGISLPIFLFAMLLIIIFAVFLGWLPLMGMHSPLIVPGEVSFLTMFFDRVRHMILPVMAMTLSSLGVMTRYVRATMCDALTEDYVRTARAKGLAEKVVIYSHAFRNVMIPLVTSITGMFMTLFSGSVVIESIFSWSGMGQVMLSSIMRQDYAITMSMQIFYALVAVVALLVMDLVYGLVDPRIRVAR